MTAATEAMLTVSEAAAIVGISASLVSRAVRTGELSGTRPDGSTLITRADLDAWEAQHGPALRRQKLAQMQARRLPSAGKEVLEEVQVEVSAFEEKATAAEAAVQVLVAEERAFPAAWDAAVDASDLDEVARLRSRSVVAPRELQRARLAHLEALAVLAEAKADAFEKLMGPARTAVEEAQEAVRIAQEEVVRRRAEAAAISGQLRVTQSNAQGMRQRRRGLVGAAVAPWPIPGS